MHEALVPRWRHSLLKGLQKEEAIGILNKYEIILNHLVNLEPPKLNPEIPPILDKHSIVRGAYYVEVQNQLRRGISALGKGLNTILKNLEKVPLNIQNSSKIDHAQLVVQARRNLSRVSL